jgi:uncharacterized protein (DUF1800 family)
LTEREKIAHLLRRFGFGAGTLELETYAPLGYKGTLDSLLSFGGDDGFRVPVWQFAFNKKDANVNMDPRIVTNWWALRMAMTARPLEQKLTLFWSNLLVVGADKVNFAPMTHEYLETLRQHGSGPFSDLLSKVSKTPAMLRYLDGENNLWGRPNENFAREVMELFTMGIGHYTEQDVKEAARAFTGWWMRFVVNEGDGKHYQDRVRKFLLDGRPMVCACEIPGIHDPGPKTVLGKTKNYTGDELLAELSQRPATATRLGKRLWEFFGSPVATPGIQAKMAMSIQKRKGDIRLVLRDMTTMPEFWSKACVRQQYKSPVDFVIGVTRMAGVPATLRTRPVSTDPTTPIDDALRDASGNLASFMEQQGLLLLHPQNVKGWDWGESWITSNAMLKRIEFAPAFFYRSYAGEQVGKNVAVHILNRNPADDAAAVKAFMEMFDVQLAPEKQDLLLKEFIKSGGLAALQKPNQAAGVLANTGKLMFGAPEFQYC